MLIVEIIALDNGAHRNQDSNLSIQNIPEGWAVVPEDMELENFPFGEVTAEEIDGVMTVTDANLVTGNLFVKSVDGDSIPYKIHRSQVKFSKHKKKTEEKE